MDVKEIKVTNLRIDVSSEKAMRLRCGQVHPHLRIGCHEPGFSVPHPHARGIYSSSKNCPNVWSFFNDQLISSQLHNQSSSD